MVCAIGTAWAGDVFTDTFNGGKATSSPEGFFTHSSTFNFNSKFADAEYDDNKYTNGLKMESATKISFTTTAVSTVTIVESDWESKTVPHGTPKAIKLDGNVLAITNAEKGTNCYIHTVTELEAGNHEITRNDGECGLFLVKVEYTGAVMTPLDPPSITFDANTGEVEISPVANATKVTYTTDGSTPTAESTEYTEAFVVEDGVVVKAIAIGDNESYINSTVTSETVILAVATIADPVITQYNGTVAITCETANVTIEYSLDGTNYSTYTRAFTLSEDGTVYARAKRGDNVSEVVSAEVATISKGDATKTIWMGWGSFDNNTTNVMTGKEGDEAEGIVLAITGNTEKYWSSGSDKIKEKTTIKLSNGAQNTMTLPEGMKATRVTFYSFINTDPNRTSYWAEFNGTSTSSEDNPIVPIPMGAWSNVSDRLTNPDVRVFPLDGETSSFTFTNIGEQLCFIVALDVIESPDPTIKATSEIALKAVPFNKTSTATVTLKGSNLEDGTYSVEMPEVDGLTIEPTSFTVTDGAVEQEFTVTYNSDADVESATATIVFSDGTTSAETTVTYESRATAYEQVEVSEEATWNWTGQKETVELGDNTTPTLKEETLMAEFEAVINFGENFGDAKAIAVEGMQFPSRNGFAQGSGSIIIKTTVPGYVTLVYSNTGGSNANRWPTINGAQFGDEAVGTTKTTANSPVVPAGEVAIKGTGALRYYTVTFTPADAPTITAEITDAGYATFSSLFEVEIPEGVTAYYASNSDGATVTMTSIDGGVIPAGTGVVLKGDEGSYTMTVSNIGATLQGKNLLKANLADREPSEAEYYTLAAGPKFCKSTGGILAAGKAYLVIPAVSVETEARVITMKFDGATAISELKTEAADDAIYDLSGARVSKPTKGLYIQNGKKLLVK